MKELIFLEILLKNNDNRKMYLRPLKGIYDGPFSGN